MRQPLYIHAASAISPQASFEAKDFLSPVIHTDRNVLEALDAPYADYIPPVAIRRMSRILKMSICTAMRALRDAGVAKPDGIIIGTARGGITDMETMVRDLIRLQEEALNPTAFIQSTYNSPNGWIAMLSKCDCYNQTYVHRSSAFELAVLDAQMMAAEAAAPIYLLVGCHDEMTDDHFTIRRKLGYWKHEKKDSRTIFAQPETPGSIAGEGATAFVLSNEKGNAVAKISDLQITTEGTAAALKAAILKIIADSGYEAKDISLIMTGKNGDARESHLYDDALALFPNDIPVCTFKHLCGEYETAVGFGLWITEYILRRKEVPEIILLQGSKTQQLRRILLLNHFNHGTLSIFLVEYAA